jgi:hypothetical protein
MAFGGVPNDPQRETMNEQAGFPDPSYPPTVRVTRLGLGECGNGQQISDHKGHSQQYENDYRNPEQSAGFVLLRTTFCQRRISA